MTFAPRPKTVAYQRIESSVDPLIKAVLMGDINPEAAAKQAAEKINVLLKEVNEYRR